MTSAERSAEQVVYDALDSMESWLGAREVETKRDGTFTYYDPDSHRAAEIAVAALRDAGLLAESYEQVGWMNTDGSLSWFGPPLPAATHGQEPLYRRVPAASVVTELMEALEVSLAVAREAASVVTEQEDTDE